MKDKIDRRDCFRFKKIKMSGQLNGMKVYGLGSGQIKTMAIKDIIVITDKIEIRNVSLLNL